MLLHHGHHRGVVGVLLAGGCGAAVSKNPPTLHVLEAPDRLNEWTNEETLMLEKQAIIDKLQGSVSTYVTCGGVVKIF